MTAVVDCLSVGRFCETQGLCPSATGEPRHYIRNPDNFEKHRMGIEDLDTVKYPNNWAWVLEDVVKYEQEMPRVPTPGAQIWIELTVESCGYSDSSESESSY